MFTGNTMGKYPAAVGLFALILFLGGCQGLTGNNGNGGGNPPPPAATLQSVNHVVFMLQENRSFDSYFGKLPEYWATHNFPAQQFDGLPADASNPSFDGTTTINSFRMKTMCISDLSPSWNESHVDWNRQSPTSSTPTMDGYVFNSAKFARNNGDHDTEGMRSMGYYTGDDLNYYYFMASSFSTSDNWFSPVMSRTPPNRQYLLAATSAGHAYPSGPIANKTIFQALEEKGVSWKVYETDANSSYLRGFQPFADQHPNNFVPASTFITDARDGTLPAVAMIESGYRSGLDEHPNNNVQSGAAYASTFINALMLSPSWKDSIFILTFDEGGGMYDHVPPKPAIHPDDIPPSDLQPGDICSNNTDPICDFKYTGFRVPLIVISPFARKNYVSHTFADYTAILRLIERRYSLDPLTKRDAAQMDMTEFFNFDNPPWMTPPTPPEQVTTGVCDFDQLQ